MRKATVISLVVCGFLFPCFGDKTFYFPHFGDGGGVSTIISVTNPCAQGANVTLSVYGPDGVLQKVEFTTGVFDRTTFAVSGHSTKTFGTAGLSSPVKSGYIQIQSDVETITATALLRFQGGLEAGILPVSPAKRFGLYVEQNAIMQTGIAVHRTVKEPVDLVLYDTAGFVKASTSMPLDGLQSSKFLGELFPKLPASFSGFLHIDSSQPITAMGLRFGGGVLSTVAVDQDRPIGQVMTEKFLGLWFMEYKIATVYEDQYAVFQSYEDPDDPGEFYAIAMRDDGHPALCHYIPTTGNYLMLALGTTSNKVYEFAFTKSGDVSGCYYSQNRSSGDLSDCRPLVGTRYDPTASSASSASSQEFGARIQEMRSVACVQCEPDSGLQEHVKDLEKKAVERFGTAR